MTFLFSYATESTHVRANLRGYILKEYSRFLNCIREKCYIENIAKHKYLNICMIKGKAIVYIITNICKYISYLPEYLLNN